MRSNNNQDNIHRLVKHHYQNFWVSIDDLDKELKKYPSEEVTACLNAFSPDPIFNAIHHQNLELLRLLIRYKIVLPELALHAAINLGSHIDARPVIRVLLEAGADHTAISGKQTPIEEATALKRWSYVRVIAEMRPDDKNDKASYASALYDVIAHCDTKDRYELIELLLKAMSTPKMSFCYFGRNGFYPIHIAAQKNDAKAITLLCNYGVDPSMQSREADRTGEKKFTPKTPIQVALENNAPDVFRALMQILAEKNAYSLQDYSVEFINKNPSLFSNTLALHWATQAGDHRVIEALLQVYNVSGKDDWMHKTDKDKKTFLDYAIEKDDWQTIETFAALGCLASSDAAKKITRLALGKVLAAGKIEIASALVMMGAKWNDSDNVLLMFMQAGQLEVVSYLLEQGASTKALAVDDYCVGDWMFHSEQLNLDIARALFSHAGDQEIRKFIAKCYNLMADNNVPQWLRDPTVLQAIFPDLQLPQGQEGYRQEAYFMLLTAMQAGSREALSYMENELAAPQKSNYRPAQIALANYYLDPAVKDASRVAYWAFQPQILDNAGRNFFRDKEIRSELSKAQIIGIYILNFYNESEINSELCYGLLEGVTNEDIDCAFVNNPKLWVNHEEFVFALFEKNTTQVLLSEREKADFLLCAFLQYSTHATVKKNFPKYIATIKDPESLAGLTNIHLLMTCLNNELVHPSMLAHTGALSGKLIQEILLHLDASRQESNASKVHDALNLYLAVLRQEQIEISDLEVAAKAYEFIHLDPTIKNKSELKSKLRAAAYSKLREMLPLYETHSERLEILDKMIEKDVFKEVLQPSGYLARLYGASCTPEVTKLCEIREATKLDMERPVRNYAG